MTSCADVATVLSPQTNPKPKLTLFFFLLRFVFYFLFYFLTAQNSHGIWLSFFDILKTIYRLVSSSNPHSSEFRVPKMDEHGILSMLSMLSMLECSGSGMKI